MSDQSSMHKTLQRFIRELDPDDRHIMRTQSIYSVRGYGRRIGIFSMFGQRNPLAMVWDTDSDDKARAAVVRALHRAAERQAKREEVYQRRRATLSLMEAEAEIAVEPFLGEGYSVTYPGANAFVFTVTADGPEAAGRVAQALRAALST